MPTVQTEGVQSATITTEHTLATVTTAANLQLAVDFVNHAKGDVTEVRKKTKLTSGDTSQIAWTVTIKNALGSPNVEFDPASSPIESVYTLKQTAGTGRSFIWAVYNLA